MREKKRISVNRVLVSIALILILIAGGTIFFYMYVMPPKVPAIGGASSDASDENSEDMLVSSMNIAPVGVTDSDRKKNFYTFLIIGLDESWHTDTIMVGSYDAVNKKAHLIGIPRDSLVNATRKVKKINGAFGSGMSGDGGKEGGVAQLRREIKTIIGFVPDFYVLVNLKAFVEIVDAVGGVEVEAKYDMKYRDPTQNLDIDITQGTHLLNGSEALTFARYRMGAKGYRTISDYERIENQQAVINALLSEMAKPGNWLKVPEYIDIVSNNVFTNLSTTDLAWFAGQIKDIKGTDALSSHTMPTTGTSGLPMYYELLDKEKIVELVNSTINPYKIDIKAEDLDILSRAP